MVLASMELVRLAQVETRWGPLRQEVPRVVYRALADGIADSRLW